VRDIDRSRDIGYAILVAQHQPDHWQVARRDGCGEQARQDLWCFRQSGRSCAGQTKLVSVLFRAIAPKCERCRRIAAAEEVRQAKIASGAPVPDLMLKPQP
jgi:hypothetical protein